MDWDELAELAHEELCVKWFGKFREQRDLIPSWVSSFRDGCPSEIVEDHYGSFNWSCRLRFTDSIEWLVRFPVPGKVMDRDGKLRREVAAMCLIREKTQIPIPKIHAWGLSEDNALDLGPFIMMDYISGGESLGHLWRVGNDKRILRDDISERDFRIVYRQIAGFYLELSKLEFPNIGSLDTRNDGSIHPDLGPLTLKMQEIEAHGGVKVGGDRSVTFRSTSEYFDSVAGQGMQQLFEQPSSVDNSNDARDKYTYYHKFNTVIPRFIADDYDRNGFRLICDDFRYGNMIVNNERDLKIIAVIDWEWAYTAPYQMFCSAPRWLLIKNPIFWATPNGWEFDRYKMCLNLFLEELQHEESERYKDTPNLEHHAKLSDLMRTSINDGKFWFHELLYDCFTAGNNSAWKAICNSLPEIEECAPISARELDEFVDKKMKQLETYQAKWSVVKERTHHEQAKVE